MEERQISCICCPLGCKMSILLEGENIIEIKYNACKRGAVYARQELFEPRRILTCVCALKNRDVPLSLKSEEAVPKDKLLACMKEIRHAKVYAPVNLGDVIIQNIADTGINILASKSIE